MRDVVDPYLDPAVGDLRNLLGATSPAELRGLEPRAVFANELELPDAGIPRSNDLAELQAIHAQLFEGVYDWAGQLRVVDIGKDQDNAGFFIPVGYVEQAAGFVFAELAQADGLRGVDRDEFVGRLAYFYDQHPPVS